jgi:hypothetical protein
MLARIFSCFGIHMRIVTWLQEPQEEVSFCGIFLSAWQGPVEAVIVRRVAERRSA